ncbi:MAG: hypothetical protein GY861_28005 [bacterium]|nr:hypothetical protein [bacterium]
MNQVYLGFTGSFKGNKRDLRFYNAFVCQDDFSSFNVEWANTKKSASSCTAGTKNTLYVRPVNAQGKPVSTKLIPNYNLRATSSCGNVGKIAIKDDKTFYLEVSNCNKVGSHSVTIYSTKGENKQKATFTVTVGPFANLKVGESIQNISGKNYIKGGRNNGDYVISDCQGFIKFKFTVWDAFGNLVNFGSDPRTICAKIGAYSVHPGKQIGKVTCSGNNGQYMTHVPIKEAGLYRFSHKFPKETGYYFNVLPGAPVIEKSLMQLFGVKSTPRVNIGVHIRSSCKFVDSLNNALKGVDIQKIHKGNFSCKVERTNLAGKKYTYSGDIRPTEGGFECSYKVAAPGMHYVNGYLQINGGTVLLVPSGVNNFIATFYPNDIKKVKFYEYSRKKCTTLDRPVPLPTTFLLLLLLCLTF